MPKISIPAFATDFRRYPRRLSSRKIGAFCRRDPIDTHADDVILEGFNGGSMRFTRSP